MAHLKQGSGWMVLENVLMDDSDTSFTVVIDHKSNSLFAIKRDKLLRYELSTNLWTKSTIKPILDGLFHSLDERPAAMNCDQRKIFINYKRGAIAILTLNNGNRVEIQTIVDLHEMGTGLGGAAIMIDDEFHIIGTATNEHIKYEINTNKVKILHRFDQCLHLDDLFDHAIVRVNDHRCNSSV